MRFILDWFSAFQPMDASTLLRTLADVLVVTFLFYKVILLARGTRAWQILTGLAIFFVALALSRELKLVTLSWLLGNLVYMGPVAIVILFYPELRHGLEQMGRIGFWGSEFSVLRQQERSRAVEEIVRAVSELASKRIGALIVIERETGLDDIADTGTRLDAALSAELLTTIFQPGAALHDQAVIVSGNRIVAASCVLPLTDDPSVGMGVHTRHRAALGVTEQSDAVAVVVSEETGTISLCWDRKMVRGLNKETLRDRLMSLLQPTVPAPSNVGRGFLTSIRRVKTGTK
ncbi:MAG: diadenylate cyclase CdaA [Armatimonadota bacterium]